MMRLTRPICSIRIAHNAWMIFAVIALCIIALAGCDRETNNSQTTTAKKTSPSKPASIETERGPVRVAITADPIQVSVGEKVQLTIDVVAEEGVSVQMPVIEQALGEFSVRQRNTPPDVPEQGKRHWKHTYILDTFATGEIEIPSLEVNYTDRTQKTIDERGEAIEAVIALDPIAVTVTSVLAENTTESDFRDIREAIDVPTPSDFDRRPFVRAAAIALLVLVGTAGLLFLWRVTNRMQRPATERIAHIPPHVQAMLALDELEEKQWIEQSKFHEYYFELSAIVRRYIEGRFGLMAPERTTDEFLREAQRDTRLTESQRDLLITFLRTADMVKFARFEPSADDARDALSAARNFVIETQPGEAVDHDELRMRQQRRKPAGAGVGA